MVMTMLNKTCDFILVLAYKWRQFRTEKMPSICGSECTALDGCSFSLYISEKCGLPCQYRKGIEKPQPRRPMDGSTVSSNPIFEVDCAMCGGKHSIFEENPCLGKDDHENG